MTGIVVRFRFKPRSAIFRMAVAAFLMAASAGDLTSESVTLTTYYPAPSGVYAQMITTGKTYLAKDGQAVMIGGAVVPSPAGGPSGTTLAVESGYVGIDKTNALVPLDVNGTVAATNLQVNGTAAAGTNCTPNGLVAQDGTGILLSCQSGMWQSPSTSGGTFWYRTPINFFTFESNCTPFDYNYGLIAPNATSAIIAVRARMDGPDCGNTLDETCGNAIITANGVTVLQGSSAGNGDNVAWAGTAEVPTPGGTLDIVVSGGNGTGFNFGCSASLLGYRY